MMSVLAGLAIGWLLAIPFSVFILILIHPSKANHRNLLIAVICIVLTGAAIGGLVEIFNG